MPNKIEEIIRNTQIKCLSNKPLYQAVSDNILSYLNEVLDKHKQVGTWYEGKVPTESDKRKMAVNACIDSIKGEIGIE